MLDLIRNHAVIEELLFSGKLKRALADRKIVRQQMSNNDNNRILLVHPLGDNSEQAGQDVSRLANVMPPLKCCDNGFSRLKAFLTERAQPSDRNRDDLAFGVGSCWVLLSKGDSIYGTISYQF